MGRGAPRHVPQCSRRSPFYRYGAGESTSPYRAVVSRSSPRSLSCGRPWARTRRCSPPGPVPARRHSPLCSAVALCQLRISGIAVIPIFWNCTIPFFRSCRNSIRFGAIIAARHAGAPPSAPLARPLTMPLRTPCCPSPPRSRTPPTALGSRGAGAPRRRRTRGPRLATRARSRWRPRPRRSAAGACPGSTRCRRAARGCARAGGSSRVQDPASP